MPLVRVTEFTDPYCVWCWGAEPVRRRLEEVYRDQIGFEFVMGGLVEDFDQYSDPVREGESEGDVAAHWQSAAQRHGMPVDVSLWRDDPPASSYPACVAYEAATMQDAGLADAFLRRMREAGLARGANLEREAVLGDLASEVGLDAEQFRADLDSGEARAAFEADRQTARKQGATSFPTFRVEIGDETELLRGYKPFESFQKLFANADADLREHDPRSVPALLDHYGRLATQEVAEVRDVSPDAARSTLSALADEGRVRRIAAGSDFLWEPA
jgi:putative protein-disulfide isomerase